MSAMPTFLDCIVIYLVSICIYLSIVYNFGQCQEDINYKKMKKKINKKINKLIEVNK